MPWFGDTLTLFDKLYRVQGHRPDPVDLKYSLPGSLVLTMVSAYTLGSWSPALTMASTCNQGHGQQP